MQEILGSRYQSFYYDLFTTICTGLLLHLKETELAYLKLASAVFFTFYNLAVCLQVAFKAKDNDESGFISPKDFLDIMTSIKSHLLTDPVKANVISACQGRQVSYPFFVAFINLLSNIELIKKVYLNATNGSRTLEVTKGET